MYGSAQEAWDVAGGRSAELLGGPLGPPFFVLGMAARKFLFGVARLLVARLIAERVETAGV